MSAGSAAEQEGSVSIDALLEQLLREIPDDRIEGLIADLRAERKRRKRAPTEAKHLVQRERGARAFELRNAGRTWKAISSEIGISLNYIQELYRRECYRRKVWPSTHRPRLPEHTRVFMYREWWRLGDVALVVKEHGIPRDDVASAVNYYERLRRFSTPERFEKTLERDHVHDDF